MLVHAIPPVPDVRDTTRREFFALLAAAGLVTAGCGAETGAAPQRSTRTVAGGAGPVEVPVRPQRVVTLGEALTGHLASVGLLPVGAQEGMAAWLDAYRSLLPPEADVESIVPVGVAETPNLELIAQLDPELILIERDAMAFHEKLSRIAPTVVIDRPSNADWRTAFDQAVEAADRADEAAVVRDRYHQAVARVPEAARQTTVTFLRGRGADGFRIDGTGAFAGDVAAEAGFAVDNGGAGGRPSEHGYVAYSLEQLSAVTGDVIVVPTRPGVSGTEGLEDSPLWPGLPAVRSGRVLRLPNAVYNGGTYVAAQLLVQALSEGVLSPSSG
ncbi:ABC transporter substrate-binding protein [Pseudonocardia asaccharolytica DSM 44247 = NBRC 16224]|uniref:ABC transporter substrate-binding protein n=2 Tax=Pseudonocardia asaccharolytica TaxID=54010 RepID=A0A511D553_9PSEU|nr:ABC transporter substrate-binding protein [Pseudonocardia asaccharolytica DSM 44247 = NBRC 16224]